MTALAPGGLTLGDQAPGRSHRTSATEGAGPLVATILIAVIALQRLALPLGAGQVPFVLPVVVAAVAWAVRTRTLRVDPLRRQLFLLAVVWCAGATTVACWRGLAWSPLSIVYLTVTYSPFIFRLRQPTAERYEAALSLFLKVMTVAAIVGIAQVAIQLVGAPYVDPLSALPERLVMRGYHTSYPVIYGSSIYKANGVLFLEPSFYSQFLALAFVIHVYLRRRGMARYLLLAGIVASVSGTGIILAVAGVLALGLTARRRQLARLAAGALVVACLLSISPAGPIFTSRIQESSSDGSSAQGRFIAPYSLSAAELFSDPATMLTGRGPGAAERIARQIEETTGLAAVFPVVAKVALEYGLPALVLFLAFILTSTLHRVPSVPLAVPLLVMYFALSGSLLQPVTVFTVYTLTSLFTDDGSSRRGRSRASPDAPVGRTNP